MRPAPTRGLFNNDHSVGKGDKPRSGFNKKWHDNFDGIDWHREPSRPKIFKKVYGGTRHVEPLDTAPKVVVH